MKKLLIALIAMISFSGMLMAQNIDDIKADAEDAASGLDTSDAQMDSLPSGVSAGDLGLRVGLGFSVVADFLNKGDDFEGLSGVTGGDGFKNMMINNAAAAGAAAPTVSGEGKALGITGLAFDLNVEYDIMPFLFARTGFGYTQGLGTENKLSFSGDYSYLGGPGGTNVDTSMTVTTASHHMEIPLLIGVNFINTGKSAVYGAAGIEYSMGYFKNTLSGTGTVAGTTTTYKDVENEVSASGIAVAYVVGGRTEVAEKINVFFEWKKLSSANLDFVTATKNDGTSSYATSAPLNTALAASALKDNGLIPDLAGNKDTADNAGGLNMSYQKFVLGVSYSL